MSEVAKAIVENRAREVRQAWAEVLSSKAGRLAIWSLLEDCHLFSQTHAGDAHDGFRAGMREVGLRVLNGRVFAHDVRAFSAMQIEHAEMMARLKLAAEQAKEQEDD